MHGVGRVEDIRLIVYGFGYALEPNERKEYDEFITGFRRHINEHFQTSKDHEWSKLIRFYSGGDTHSIELFLELINKYKEKALQR